MKTQFLKSALLAAFMPLAACSGGPFNGAQHALTIAETHPIAVDAQVVTLTIAPDPLSDELSMLDKARLRAFADAYLNNGHGPLMVVAPSGAGKDRRDHEAAADIRTALNEAGMPWPVIGGATYRTGEPGSEIILSYTRYVATASPCGVWKGMTENAYRNLRTPNMGCATMNNYAAMIADPHDLIAPAEEAPRDGAFAARAVSLYRAGQITASQIDAAITSEASSQ